MGKITGKILRVLNPVLPVERMLASVPRYRAYLKDLKAYRKMLPESSVVEFVPSIWEKDAEHEFDAHYQYQPLWASRLIIAKKPSLHIDIGSQLNFGLSLSLVIPVTFIDFRTLEVPVENYKSLSASILDLPFPDNSIESLSSMHVIEHIGLGRYGDPLNVSGTTDAAKELARVLKQGGDLYVTTPVGKMRTAFNSHRIHTASSVVSMFSPLELVSLDVIDDSGKWIRNTTAELYDTANYALGMFHFTKK